MMVKAKGPVWHAKHRAANYVPAKLRNLDKQATWCKSRADGWVYGHGTFSMVSHRVPVLGLFLWMPNSGNEAKRMYQEAPCFQKALSWLAMDSKADDQKIFHGLRNHCQINLVTVCRKTMNKTQGRRDMIAIMQSSRRQRILKERSYTVEPMQGLVKNIFDLDRCWMKGDHNNRWLFAAMGIAIQMAQLNAFNENRSTWKIKSEVLGEP